MLKKLILRLVGTPKDFEASKLRAPVQAPEFDVTQYAKKLAIVIGVLFPAVLAALKTAKVDITDGVVMASLGVTAFALVGACVVMAADVAARAYVHRTLEGQQAPDDGTPTRPMMTVWLHGDTQGCPVLAIERATAETAYLVLRGSTSQKEVAGLTIDVYDSAPQWIAGADISACAP